MTDDTTHFHIPTTMRQHIKFALLCFSPLFHVWQEGNWRRTPELVCQTLWQELRHLGNESDFHEGSQDRLPFSTFSTKLTRIQVHGSRCLVPNCASSAWRSPIVPSLLSAANLPKAFMNLMGWSSSAMRSRRYGIMITVSVCHLWWTPNANVEGHKFLFILPAQKPVAPPGVFQ